MVISCQLSVVSYQLSVNNLLVNFTSKKSYFVLKNSDLFEKISCSETSACCVAGVILFLSVNGQCESYCGRFYTDSTTDTRSETDFFSA